MGYDELEYEMNIEIENVKGEKENLFNFLSVSYFINKMGNTDMLEILNVG